MTGKKFRLITRSDMDGIVSAALLQDMGLLNEIVFVHPKDMQDGKIKMGADTITTNLPYVDGVGLAFDHHSSEEIRLKGPRPNLIIDASAPSAARVVYNYYGGKARFKNISPELMTAVDKIDSAQLTRDEILSPDNWLLLGFLMDSRTGLGRFHHFRISNYQLMLALVDHFRRNIGIDAILAIPDVAERVKLYKEHAQLSVEQIKRCAAVHDKLVVLDFRREEQIFVNNRFAVYALFPDCNISMHVLWGKQQQNTVFAVGKSILNRTAKVDVGALMLAYGGGGHKAAGTCQPGNDTADTVLAELTRKIAAAG